MAFNNRRRALVIWGFTLLYALLMLLGDGLHALYPAHSHTSGEGMVDSGWRGDHQHHRTAGCRTVDCRTANYRTAHRHRAGRCCALRLTREFATVVGSGQGTTSEPGRPANTGACVVDASEANGDTCVVCRLLSLVTVPVANVSLSGWPTPGTVFRPRIARCTTDIRPTCFVNRGPPIPPPFPTDC